VDTSHNRMEQYTHTSPITSSVLQQNGTLV